MRVVLHLVGWKESTYLVIACLKRAKELGRSRLPSLKMSPSTTGFSVAIGILQDLRIKKRRAEGLVSLCVDVRSL